jgi:hypothetical protein
MEFKICSSCNIEKYLDNFHKYKQSKDGHTHRCKICVSRKKVESNTEKKCKICLVTKPLQDFNKRKNGKFGCTSTCKSCNNKKKKDWKESNKFSFLEKRRLYRKKRSEVDPSFKLVNNLRCRLNDFLNFRKFKKNNKTIVLIGCTPQQLKIYLESKFLQNMSWENYGYRGWHVDHIIPLSSAKNYNDIYKLFHYTNLQPMWGIDNMIKGNKIKESESSNQQ